MWKNCGQVSPAYDYCRPSQVSPAYDYCGPNQVSPAYDMGNHCKGSMFVLIVVLFILLIIVGKCYM